MSFLTITDILSVAIGALQSQDRAKDFISKLAQYDDVEKMVTDLSLHEKLCAEVDGYSSFMEKSDTVLLIKSLLSSEAFSDLISRFLEVDPDMKSLALASSLLNDLDGILAQIELSAGSESDLLSGLRLRDRLYSFIKSVLYDMASNMSVLDNLSVGDREVYMRVYEGTIDHQLSNIFGLLTDSLSQAAKLAKVPFKPEYSKLGYAYSPN